MYSGLKLAKELSYKIKVCFHDSYSLTKANGATAETKNGFYPPHPHHTAPLHQKLFFKIKTIFYWTYHTESWQGAIYYDIDKYYVA